MSFGAPFNEGGPLIFNQSKPDRNLCFLDGDGLAHRYIMEGKLLKWKGPALAAGLVDELVPLDTVFGTF